MLLWIGGILGILIGLILIMTIIGAALPKAHVATRTMQLSTPADQVWATIADGPGWPSWNPGCKSLDVMPENEGRPVWKFGDGGRGMTMVVEEFTPPQRMVTRIADKGLPFGGTWSYEVSPRGTGCEVRLTENGEIYPPPFRFMARFVFGYTATIDGFLKALAKRFGEAAVIG